MKRLILVPLTWLAAVFFLIEEFIWDQTARLMARLGMMSWVHAIERHIAGLSPHWALLAFLLPSSIIIPAKFLGLHALASGHWVFGTAIFVLAKLLGLALLSRIFNLTRSALMQLPWFAGLYAKVMFYRNRIHFYLDQWQAYQRVKKSIKSFIATVKARMPSV